MKITISVLKADIGSIGGHIKPSQKVNRGSQEAMQIHRLVNLLIDYYLSSTGDDIAILCNWRQGRWSFRYPTPGLGSFSAGTEVAKKSGLYGAGQDLAEGCFFGQCQGNGSGCSRNLYRRKRANEAFIFFAADKTDPGAYNLPFYLAFADPAAVLLRVDSQSQDKPDSNSGYGRCYVEKNKTIELHVPEDLYDLGSPAQRYRKVCN